MVVRNEGGEGVKNVRKMVYMVCVWPLMSIYVPQSVFSYISKSIPMYATYYIRYSYYIVMLFTSFHLNISNLYEYNMGACLVIVLAYTGPRAKANWMKTMICCYHHSNDILELNCLDS